MTSVRSITTYAKSSVFNFKPCTTCTISECKKQNYCNNIYDESVIGLGIDPSGNYGLGIKSPIMTRNHANLVNVNDIGKKNDIDVDLDGYEDY
jgi:hypothetical protein